MARFLSVVIVLNFLLMIASSIQVEHLIDETHKLQHTYMYRQGDKHYLMTNHEQERKGLHLCAQYEYHNTLFEIGWNKIYVQTFQQCSSKDQMFSAGYLEGYVGQQDIYNFYHNIRDDISKRNYDGSLSYFNQIHRNLKHKFEELENMKEGDTQDFWRTNHLFYIQTQGIFHGYDDAAKLQYQQLKFADIILINVNGQQHEFEDKLQREKIRFQIYGASQKKFSLHHQKIKQINQKRKSYLKQNQEQSYAKFWEKKIIKTHCSVMFQAIVDQDGNLEDFLATHSTWQPYSFMLRYYRFYDLQLTDTPFVVQFSGYPGAVSSSDDWYFVQNQLIITQTTLSSLDLQFYDQIDYTSVQTFDFLRIMSSTFLSNSGNDWIQNMKIPKLSGYNSEWMILDVSKLEKGKKLKKQTFHVLEQGFGTFIHEDFSEYLNYQSWFSYNNPYYEEIRSKTGYSRLQEKYPQLGYQDDPRSIIFQIHNPKVRDIKQLKWLMRHNPWDGVESITQDDAKFGSPMQHLGSRGDVGKREQYFGETDVKVVNLEMIQSFTCEAESGPSHQELPVFIWNKQGIPNRGLPKTWNFEWVEMTHKDSSFSFKN